MSEKELFETLYKIQQEKRCIVFLDDIWTKQDWKDIRAAFPVKNTRSKLLIMTRNKEVADYIDPQGFLCEPSCLSNEESWKLLTKRLFPKTTSKVSLRFSSSHTVAYRLFNFDLWHFLRIRSWTFFRWTREY